MAIKNTNFGTKKSIRFPYTRVPRLGIIGPLYVLLIQKYKQYYQVNKKEGFVLKADNNDNDDDKMTAMTTMITTCWKNKQ